MSSLAGLVNYSDDEDSSSSGDEQKVVQINKAVHNKEIVKEKPEPIDKTKKDNTANLPKPILPTEHANSKLSSVMNEYNRRLMAALAPKPIEGVENWGIPDEPDTPCDPEREEKIAHFLSLRASGHCLNDHLQRNKAFRNPRIYTKLVEFAEVDEFGSNFSKDDFDPHGFSKDMYIDGILETQKRIAEEKAAQQQNRTSVNFVPQKQVSPSTQQAAMAQAMATAAKVASRIVKPPKMEVPEKRKSKWDDDSSHKRR